MLSASRSSGRPSGCGRLLAEVSDQRAHLDEQRATITRELDRLTAAIVAGGELSTLTAAIREAGAHA